MNLPPLHTSPSTAATATPPIGRIDSTKRSTVRRNSLIGAKVACRYGGIHLALAALVVFVMTALAAPTYAQCPPGWLPGEGIPGVNNIVYALVVLPDGDVIVGGRFNSIGSVSANNIARYNPTTGVWSALGTGVGGVSSGYVLAIAVTPGGELIVGGQFASAGGTAASRIARYNPTTGVWSALGAGVNGTVRALAVLPNGDVLAGGDITSAGGVPTIPIVRYAPTPGGGGIWSSLGTGMIGNAVRAIVALPGGDIIAAGNFSLTGGVGANSIARFNPTSGAWSALGPGTFGSFDALALLPDESVIAGGGFSISGGLQARGIARYNPATGEWSTLGTGFGGGGGAQAIAVLPDGDIVACGGFTLASGSPAAHIARYNFQTGVWSALGSGIVGFPNALVVLPGPSVSGAGGMVVVGGQFSTAGGFASSNLARYALGGLGTKCHPADIAWDNGQPLPPAGPCDLQLVNSGVCEGDYNAFFEGFFDAAAQCDIADDQGTALPPFGTGGTGGVPNSGVNEADYSCFFQFFFEGCS